MSSQNRSKQTACQRCHDKKVKCSGGNPCGNCTSANSECMYPTRDRNITVSENYLRGLESAVTQARFGKNNDNTNQLLPPATSGTTATTPTPPHRTNVDANNDAQSISRKRFFESTTAEAFGSKLRKIGDSHPSISQSADLLDPSSGAELDGVDDQQSITGYEWFPLPSDKSTSRMTLKLPPYPYVMHLVNQFEAFLGFEYHWYLRRSFYQRLEATYTNKQSGQSRSRAWLCSFLVVLALGESFDSKLPPAIEVMDDSDTLGYSYNKIVTSSSSPPGAQFFDQAMSLWKLRYEEATIEDIEALNLMAFYSYSLNRRKSAYIYAGLSVRIACCLGLHRPSSSKVSTVQTEHRKRVWWTTYQLDAMTGSEMGMNAAFNLEEIEVQLPSANDLAAIDCAEFMDSTIFIAHIHLYDFREGVLSSTVSMQDLKSRNIHVTLMRPLNILSNWRKLLPEHINFEFSQGVPPAMIAMPEMRSLASVYLRFHHCYVVLLRPVLLRLLTMIMNNDQDRIHIGRLTTLGNDCLEAAIFNIRILKALWQNDKIAKFGFWESLHLFSSLQVVVMSSTVAKIQPASLEFPAENELHYQDARLLLSEMAEVGNIASKGHMKLLEEAEQLRHHLIEKRSNIIDAMQADFDLDMSRWLEMLDDADLSFIA